MRTSNGVPHPSLMLRMLIMRISPIVASVAMACAMFSVAFQAPAWARTSTSPVFICGQGAPLISPPGRTTSRLEPSIVSPLTGSIEFADYAPVPRPTPTPAVFMGGGCPGGFAIVALTTRLQYFSFDRREHIVLTFVNRRHQFQEVVIFQRNNRTIRYVEPVNHRVSSRDRLYP